MSLVLPLAFVVLAQGSFKAKRSLCVCVWVGEKEYMGGRKSHVAMQRCRGAETAGQPCAHMLVCVCVHVVCYVRACVTSTMFP